MNLLTDLIEPNFFEYAGDGQSLIMLLIRFLVNFLITGGIIRFLYYPRSRRRDYFFTFLLTSTTIFMLLFLLDSVQIQVGFALGLFAIFGILRYRTDTLPIREMTYLFMIIGISVINALYKNASWLDLAVINLIFIAVTWIMESSNILRHVSSKKIIYERIDLIRPENEAALLADLKNRTGLNISKVEVGTIDFLKDTALLNVYYNSNEANMADSIDRDDFRSENDD